MTNIDVTARSATLLLVLVFQLEVQWNPLLLFVSLIDVICSSEGKFKMAAGLSSRTADSPSRPPGPSSQSPRVIEPTMDRLKILYPTVNEEETPLPRSWSPKDKYNFIGLSQNNSRVHYKGKFMQIFQNKGNDLRWCSQYKKIIGCWFRAEF